MSSKVYILCSLLAFLQIVLQLTTFVSNRWFIVVSNEKAVTGIGLFKTGVFFAELSTSTCLFIYIVVNLFGCLYNVIFICYCMGKLCLSTPNPDRVFVKVQALICLLSGVIAITVLIWMSKSVIDSSIHFGYTSINFGNSFYLGCCTAAAHLLAAIILCSVMANRAIEDDTSRLISEGPEVMMRPTESQTTGNTSYPRNDIPVQSSLPPGGLSDNIPLEVSENASGKYLQTAIKEYPQTDTGLNPQRITVTGGCPTEYKLSQDDPSYKYDQDPENDFLSQY